MTGPHSETESPGTRPISVAELLARNGSIGAPAVSRRRRRRRGDDDAVTVAELTGEIPVIRDDDHDETEHAPNGTLKVAEPAPETHPEPDNEVSGSVADKTEDRSKTAYWSESEPRWPKSSPRSHRVSGPERSAYPRPLRQTKASDAEQSADDPSAQQSGAEEMSPDPVDEYTEVPVDVMDSDVREAEPAADDSAYVRSFLQGLDSTSQLDSMSQSDSTSQSDSILFGGQTLADEMARGFGRQKGVAGADGPGLHQKLDAKHLDKADRARESRAAGAAGGGLEALWRGTLIVLQSILAVAFGAGLFIAFDQLWRWNSLVALVLSVLVILGLVAGVRVVRKTEDIASTLIAVAVGALITLGPLALSLQSG